MSGQPTDAPGEQAIRRAPKVLLHDHLDGGLRPQTVIELADAVGYGGLPSTQPQALAAWFVESASSGSLVRYLQTFDHTVAVMQTATALRRVAAEAVLDLAADGVVYAEIRFAPEQHLRAGLELDEVVAAVVEGAAHGSEQAAAGGSPIQVRVLLTAMRHAARSLEIAELAMRWRDRGVVGFDIAGAEAGNPPTRHLDAFQYVARENGHTTIHAGEAFGLPSIWEALQWCGADRLGHGVRIVDDIAVPTDGGRPRLGRLAGYVRDRRVPLELCPTSNVQTGAVGSLAAHPLGLLAELAFRVTVNTDNRLMGGTTLSREIALAAATFGWGWPEIRRVSVNAMKSAFIAFDERLAIIEQVLKPAYAELVVPGRA